MVDDFPESIYTDLALRRMIVCQTIADVTSYDDLMDYYESISDSTDIHALARTTNNATAWCLAEMEEFDDAEDELNGLIRLSRTREDSVSYTLTMLFVRLKELYSRDRLNKLASGSNSIAGMTEEQILKDIDELLTSGKFPDQSERIIFPKEFAFGPLYPNPFNSIIGIAFAIPEQADIRITVYNLLGKKVKDLINRQMTPGNHKVFWDGKGISDQEVSSGIYFVNMETSGFNQTKKIVLLK
ncbi:MAG: T9SS type A sorting domain-containing protein [Candidatus Electryonea clarkiae]|nr:T9SS type A sorting domain-containing protein [Candidatus Electryonea clarkiae]MDP8285493.1 T9SS type A sorting domain-containing protein [Candidatus Electryonea clarkiae]